jgi:hypothetical protein
VWFSLFAKVLARIQERPSSRKARSFPCTAPRRAHRWSSSLHFMMMEVLTVLKTWDIDKISLSGLARDLYYKSNALGTMNIISLDSTIEFQHSQV